MQRINAVQHGIFFFLIGKKKLIKDSQEKGGLTHMHQKYT